MKLALCNEVLRHLSWDAQCQYAAALGFDGLEIAPFTLADDPRTLTPALAAGWRATAAAYGLQISSLHWLLARPEGLSLSTPDGARHARTVDFLRRLIDVAAACGAQVLVHGSPQQRAPGPGQSVADALARAEDGWRQLAPAAETAGLMYCIEPLSRHETPVLNTVAEAAAVIERIGSPALRTMLDLSAAALTETDPPHAVLARHLPLGHIAHVQLNDANRRGPGQGRTPVVPVLRTLHAMRYTGWMAIEPFDYHPDPAACAAYSAGYVRGILGTLQ